MKLVIQIPCFNEAQTLPAVMKNMPRSIPGINVIEFQIIDDGSTDNTIEVARELGIHHIVRVNGRNRRWLGRAFRIGVDHALAVGADVLVNTDGDNQYPSEMIPTLIEPILNGAAQLAIGDRNPGQFAEFSPVKRFLQRLGSHTVAFVTGEDVRDAVCGFRAYSRKALLSINPITNYTYTVDTLIQAHKKGLDVSWVPIRPNARTRDSRLITSLLAKVRKSGATILRLFTIYEPFKTFLALAALFFIPALILLGRFAYFYLFVPEHATGHVQSVVIGGVFLVIAVQIGVLGIIGDLLSANRKLIEDGLTRIRRLETMETETVSDVTKINTKIEGGSRITNRKQADKIASVG